MFLGGFGHYKHFKTHRCTVAKYAFNVVVGFEAIGVVMRVLISYRNFDAVNGG